MTTSERVQALFAERDREIERLMKEWETERDAAQGAREALKMAQQQAAAEVERLSKQTDVALNVAEIWKDKAVKLAAGQPECERCGGFAVLCAKCAAAQLDEWKTAYRNLDAGYQGKLKRLAAQREEIESITIMRFRKMLDRLGIHGYYNEMMKEFDGDALKGTPAPQKGR